jgi:hypothetical protein
MPDIHIERGVRTLFLMLGLVSAALVFSLPAGASNTTLRASLGKWSRTIGADAHSISLAATRRHPRRMTFSSLRFRNDALRARAVIAAQHASNANGQKARKLALAAFADYAVAGSRWAAAGRARLSKQRSVAGRNAAAAAASARAGNRLLVLASRLAR